MTPASPDPGRTDRLRLFAAALSESVEVAYDVEYDDSARAWALAWTDGPTVAQVRGAAEAAEPETAAGLRYVRRYSENAMALGAVRLATVRRSDISPSAVEALWQDVPDPAPATEAERALVYAVVYEAHDNVRRNWVPAQALCDLVAVYGLDRLRRQ